MEIKDFNKVKENIDYIPCGIKEACIIVNEYIKNCEIKKDYSLTSPKSAVSVNDFIEAVKVILAYTWENRDNDCIPSTIICDMDCYLRKIALFCPGECQVIDKDDSNKNLVNCPYKM